MISRWNYLAITTVMLVVFFLFQFTNVALENWDGYEENSYYQDREELPGEDSAYQAGTGMTGRPGSFGDMPDGLRRRVVYIGAEDSMERNVVNTWASYTKRSFADYGTLEEYEEAEHGDESLRPEMLVIRPEDVNWGQRSLYRELEGYVDAGISLVFCGLPDADVIKNNVRLQKLLGIEKVKSEKIQLEGIYLHEGFLLGGEAVYQAENQEENEKRQDLELVLPWYTVGENAKVYMRGITEELQKTEEDYPAVIWRNHFDRAYVFAVNGSYMEDVTGLGLLTAMSSESRDYDLYPVVNAQNMVILNYPEFASENTAKMEELYGQPMSGMMRDIAWPAAVAAYRQNTLGLSCMLAPEYDYEDDTFPSKKELQYYMKRLKEQGGEAGLSGTAISDTEIRRKLREDQRIMSKELPDFQFSSFYAGGLTGEETEAALQEELLQSVRTVVLDYEGDSEIIGYQSENITKQDILSDGTKHTYREDFRMRSVQTALGYSSVGMDMTRVAYPEDADDTLEKVVSEFSGNVGYYWKNFKGFSGTTVSECDNRIRSFLALDYTESREGGSIHLELTGSEAPAWFVLRADGERVTHIDGGSFTKLEDQVWLIEAKASDIMIELK